MLLLFWKGIRDDFFFFTPCQKPYVPSNHFKTLLNFLVFKNVLVSIVTITISNEMFVRMLTVHCDQNNSYEITINGFQVRKINEIRNVIFGLRYGKPSSALRPKLGCSPSWVLDDIQRFLGEPCLNKHHDGPARENLVRLNESKTRIDYRLL